MSEVPNIPVIQNNNIQNSNPNVPYINIGANNVRYIQTFGVADTSVRGINQINETTVWINGVPTVIPPTVPVTVNIGKPIVNMPGCVVVHKENAKQRNKNKQLVNNDPKGNTVLCDAGQPYYNPPNYEANRLSWETIYGQPPEVDGGVDTGDPPPPPETPDSPEPPSTGGDELEDPPCPGPMAPRIGDIAQNQKEKVSGFDLQRDPKNPDGAKICVTLYEDIGAVEAYLPAPQIVTTTAVIASVATGSALLAKPLADLLLRVVKPVIKKAIGTIQKKLGKSPYRPTQDEIRTNEYRKKKGLLGINFAKNHAKKEKSEKEKKKKEEEKKQKDSQ